MSPAVPAFLLPLVKFTPCFQLGAVREALARREESVPHLIAALDWATDHPEEALDSDFMLHTYALHILGELREPTALPAVLRHFQSPKADDLVGDDLAADGPGILAALAGRNLEPIDPLITNRKADGFARGAGLRALGIATLNGTLTRDDLAAHIDRLLPILKGDNPGYHWDALASLIADFRLPSFRPTLRDFFHKGLCDPMFCPLADLERQILRPFDPESYEMRREYRPYGGAVASMQDWHCFQPDPDDIPGWKRPREITSHTATPSASFAFFPPALDEVEGDFAEDPALPLPKTGRNDPCPCGSGKKFKKCCGTLL